MINTKWNVIYLKTSLAINYIKCVYKNIQIVNYISREYVHVSGIVGRNKPQVQWTRL